MMTNYKELSSKIHVFLSHSWGERRKQHEFAKKICEILKQQDDLKPILDDEYFTPGTSWKNIYENIVECGKAVVIFMFSKEFLLSPNCQFELNFARNAFLTKGVPLIAVKIENVNIPEMMKDDIFVDMTRCYELFIENVVDIESEIKSKVDSLVIGIRDRIKEYENKLHITRVIHPDDRLFLESRELFTLYPRDYRDDFESVQQWIAECSDKLLEGKYFQELYYIAYYRGKCVGILYATYYRSSQFNDGYAFILPLVIKKDSEICGDQIVAHELLSRLKKDTNTKDTHCERYLVELPFIEELDKAEVEICLRGWTSLGEEDNLGIFTNLNYLSPDSKDFIKEAVRGRSKDYEAEPMLLLSVFGYPHQNMNKKEMKHEILDFLYGVYHAEGYTNPFFLRVWMELMNRLQMAVESSLPEKCQINYIDPKQLKEFIKGL